MRAAAPPPRRTPSFRLNPLIHQRKIPLPVRFVGPPAAGAPAARKGPRPAGHTLVPYHIGELDPTAPGPVRRHDASRATRHRSSSPAHDRVAPGRGVRPSARNAVPSAYCAFASGRAIRRLCGGTAPKTSSTTPYQKGRFLAREPRVGKGVWRTATKMLFF